MDVASLIKDAVPESKGRNVRVLSQNGANLGPGSGGLHRDANFLSKDFPRSQPKLYVTAEEDDFDELTVQEWRDEGFDVEYFSMETWKGKEGGYLRKLKDLSAEKMGPCEKFGIVAFGDAAAWCLEHYHILDNNPEFKLGLLIAYYPTSIPDPKGKFPSAIETLVHLTTGEEIGVTKQSQMVGIQGKRRVTRKKVEAGLGVGGSLQLAYPSYTYKAEPGFAEHDMEEYDRVSAELAWSRSLAAARRAFGNHVEAEILLETNTHSKFFSSDHSKSVNTYTTHKTPHVTNIPTLTGATGTQALQEFYTTYFQHPPSLRVTLLSRTIGSDRVVDELHVKFKHSKLTPWILPGVPPTGKKVEVLMVSIVALRGGKVFHEHVYWDQASVLVQIGLLDPSVVPEGSGIKRLPVVGREAARRMIKASDSDEGEADNELITAHEEDSRGRDTEPK
ncbi:NTF2-like protein [Sarocladium strictum]